MSKKKWLFALSFVVSGVILAFLLSAVRTADLAAALSNANPYWLAAALAVSVVAMGLRAARLHVLIHEHAPHVPFDFVFLAQMAGMAASNFSPGRALEAAKVLPLKKAGVPYAQGALAVVWERLFDLFALVLLSFLVFASLTGQEQTALVAFGVLLVLGAWFILTRAKDVLRLASRIPLLHALAAVDVQTLPPSPLAACFALTILAWLSDAVVFFFVFSALGLSFEPVLVVGSYAAAILIGALSLLPAGLGTTEAALAFLLKGASGLHNPALLAALLIGRLFTLGTTTLAGAVSVPLLAKRAT